MHQNIFEKLKINVRELKDSSRVFPFCTNFIQSTEYLDKNLNTILQNENLCTISKETDLEKLSKLNYKLGKGLEYSIPKKLTAKIVEVDEYLYDKKKETREFLTLNMAKKFGNSILYNHRKAYLTKKSKEVIEKMQIIFRIFSSNNHSFTLFLMHNLVSLCRRNLNDEAVKPFSKDLD